MSHDHPTAYYENLSGAVRCVFRCEKTDNSSDVVGRSQAFERYLLGERRARLRSHRLCHIGIDEPRGDDVSEDVSRRQLFRNGFGETDEPRLARGVIGLSLVADDTDDAGD